MNVEAIMAKGKTSGRCEDSNRTKLSNSRGSSKEGREERKRRGVTFR